MANASPLRSILLLIAFGASFLACGRPATETDCKLIFDRNVELELQEHQVSDPATIKQRQGELGAKMGSEMKDCIGKTVTESGMKCVREAKTTLEIAHCFR